MAAERRFAWKGTDRHGKVVDGVLRAADASAAASAGSPRDQAWDNWRASGSHRVAHVGSDSSSHCTGVHATDSSKGKIIAGYELETGALLWKYELDCALTSDITGGTS